MRRRRLKIRGEEAVYHCVTRTVNKEMLFDSGAKEFLRKDIWRVADFSGVEILTFCVMTNHFLEAAIFGLVQPFARSCGHPVE